MNRKKIRTIVEIILVAAAIVICALVLHKHTPKILELLEKGNVSGIESYIRAEGKKGVFTLILLQVIETVAIVLPAMPVYICAGAVYGKIQGILMCYITNIVMNIIIFVVARKMNLSTDSFAKFQKNPKLEELIKEGKHPDRIVLLMCMLPIIPNGMIPYISSKTNVTIGGFTRALAIGCLPGIAVFVVCGDFLLSEHFKITLPVVIVLAVVVAIVMILKKRVTAWLEPKIKKLL